VRRSLSPISRKDVKLCHFFEEIHLSPLVYQNLCAYNSYERQQDGIEEVSRQIQNFKQVFANARIMATMSMLFKGKIWFDDDGNLLPTSSGEFHTVDYNIPANNMNQLNGAITASWAIAATDIAGNIRNVKQASIRTTGYEVKTALYGKNIPKYFTSSNDAVKYYLARNPQKNEQFLATGEIPPGMFDIDNWIPAWKSFYEDSTATVQSFVDDDAIVFLPEVDQSQYEMMEGTFQVPKTFQPTINPASPMSDYEEIQGMFAYSVPSHNPPSATIYVGDTYLPIWKNPQSIWIADVTP
jgi:hypothetical protein